MGVFLDIAYSTTWTGFLLRLGCVSTLVIVHVYVIVCFKRREQFDGFVRFISFLLLILRAEQLKLVKVLL